MRTYYLKALRKAMLRSHSYKSGAQNMSTSLVLPPCSTPNMGVMSTLVSLLLEYLHTSHCGITRTEEYPRDYASEAIRSTFPLKFDFVVIGAGSAGSVVASRLSENPQWRVLVLEAGGDPVQESEIPLLFFAFQKNDYMYNYFTEPNGVSCKAFIGERCYWPRGKAVGGSGSINALLYLQGTRRDYDSWLELGNIGWGFDDVKPYFEKSITTQGNATYPQGYIAVENFEATDNDMVQTIFKAAQELDQPIVDHFNEDHTMGYGLVPATVSKGRRSGSGKGHLGRLSQRENLKIIKNAQVTKLRLDLSGQRVRAVDFVLNQTKRMSVNVGREAILSAGSLNTPQLLMLSGIGPKEDLKHLKIPVLHNLPVGQNLQDHVVGLLFIKFDEEEDAKRLLNMVFEYLVNQKGPLASIGTGRLVGFVKVNEYSNSSYPDLEIHHMLFRRGDLLGLKIALNWLTMKPRLRNFLVEGMQDHGLLIIALTLLKPKSRGSVTLKSKSAKDPPIIYANYFAEKDDRDILVRGFQYAERFVSTSAFQEKQMEIIQMPLRECDKFIFKSQSYWECYLKYFSSTCFHSVSTAKMGPDEDPTAVVNSRLRVKGVDNLRVIDASIMPTIAGVNANGPTIIIAEKAADMIKMDWSSN